MANLLLSPSRARAAKLEPSHAPTECPPFSPMGGVPITTRGKQTEGICCIRFGLGNARLRLYWRVTERNRKARRNSAILRYCPQASTEATNPKGPLRESPRKPRTGRKANTNRVVKRRSRPEAERIRPDTQIAPHVGRCLECDCTVVAFGQWSV